MAFIVIAVICGMVIGHALVSQAMPAPWLRAATVVPGSVFPVAPGEPTRGTVFSAVPEGTSAPVISVITSAGVTRVTATAATVSRTTRTIGHARSFTKSGAHVTRHGKGKAKGHAKHGNQRGNKHGNKHGHRGSGFTVSVRWR